MTTLPDAWDNWFQPASQSAAMAAAVTVCVHRPPPLPPAGIERALQAVAPHLTADERTLWVGVLSTRLAGGGITTPRAVAAFLGQCAVESAGFRRLEEDLNYTAGRLCQVWPARFPTVEVAQACALQPQALANRVYAQRMGNGTETSGDGWRFRGRGLIQITGRSAFEHFARAMRMTLDQATEHAACPAGATDSAVWFWTANQLNALANTWSIDLMTRKINGGMTDAAERNRLCDAALHTIGA